jgi:hypothetical protein
MHILIATIKANTMTLHTKWTPKWTSAIPRFRKVLCSSAHCQTLHEKNIISHHYNQTYLCHTARHKAINDCHWSLSFISVLTIFSSFEHLKTGTSGLVFSVNQCLITVSLYKHHKLMPLIQGTMEIK